MPKRFLFLWTAFAVLFSMKITGCSVINFAVGSAIDSGRASKLRPGTPARIYRLAPGARISIRMADGTVVAGTYRGLATQPDSSYVLRYTAWADSARGLSFRPPRIGDRIRVSGLREHSMASKTIDGAFQGFGPQRVHVRPPRKGSTFATFQGDARMIDGTGQVVSKHQLAGVWDRLPVQTIALLRTRNGERRVDLQDPRIVAVHFSEVRHTFRNSGLVVGLLADATLILAAVAVASVSSGSSCEPSYTGGGFYSLAVPIPASSVSDSIYVVPHAREWLALAR